MGSSEGQTSEKTVGLDQVQEAAKGTETLRSQGRSKWSQRHTQVPSKCFQV